MSKHHFKYSGCEEPSKTHGLLSTYTMLLHFWVVLPLETMYLNTKRFRWQSDTCSMFVARKQGCPPMPNWKKQVFMKKRIALVMIQLETISLLVPSTAIWVVSFFSSTSTSLPPICVLESFWWIYDFSFWLKSSLSVSAGRLARLLRLLVFQSYYILRSKELGLAGALRRAGAASVVGASSGQKTLFGLTVWVIFGKRLEAWGKKRLKARDIRMCQG